ncbi:DUF2218 domain-containing protein [Pseudophaeobacter sp. EL27]|uniref:DUF2218 domain-containing protein n=1 Tax=Pseudophaeobacter sp. EL27 TaxID=2107580 RepID=UPI000EFB177C|nr:DUF2218 domain-containing protein [Pseudophaeobacter sp. EL27]
MFESTAIIETERASNYLQQLCKHFGHKVPVHFDPQSGQIELPFGRCELAAEGDRLNLTVKATSQPELTKARDVIASHLERFAFRENPNVVWQAATAE